MACCLRASGPDFDVDAFVSGTSLSCDPIWRRGEPRPLAGPRKTSGFTAVVSEAAEFNAQVAGAIAFLQDHGPEIARLVAHPGVESVCLDFSVMWRANMAAQFSHLPAELVALAGNLGLSLEVSHYAASGS
jgi:hypothetical protein